MTLSEIVVAISHGKKLNSVSNKFSFRNLTARLVTLFSLKRILFYKQLRFGQELKLLILRARLVLKLFIGLLKFSLSSGTHS